VKSDVESDRRQYPRFPYVLDILAHDCPPLNHSGPPRPSVLGRVQNVSQGGICVLSQKLIPRSALLRCEVGVSEVPVAIPTLLQVCWSRKQNVEAASYLTGLKFLL